MRAFGAVGVALGAFVAGFLLDVEEVSVLGFQALALVILSYDVVIFFLVRRHLDPADARGSRRRLERILFHASWADFVSLTVMIWMIGGARSPFMPFYLLHLVISSLMLERKTAVSLGVIAFGLIAALVVGDWSGYLPPHPLPSDLAIAGTMTGRAAMMLLGIYGLVIFGTLYLFTSLAHELREGEEGVRLRARRLGHVASMRKDFLRVSTHNIRSPVGAATMFLRNLDNGLGGELNERQGEWVRRALRRLTGLHDFLTEISQFSALEAGQITMDSEVLSIGELLQSVATEYRDDASERGQELILEIAPDLPQVRGTSRLLREAIANYVTNAIKYTPEGGCITLRASKELGAKGGVRVEAIDTGSGIEYEDRERVFEEFVRIPRRDEASDPSPDGTGLGLAITKRIVEAHGGSVGVDEVSGGGSCFTMTIPAARSTS